MDFSVSRSYGAITLVISPAGHGVDMAVAEHPDMPGYLYVSLTDQGCATAVHLVMPVQQLCELSAVISKLLGARFPQELSDALERVTGPPSDMTLN